MALLLYPTTPRKIERHHLQVWTYWALNSAALPPHLKRPNDVLNLPSLAGAALNQQDLVSDLQASARLSVLQLVALERGEGATRHCGGVPRLDPGAARFCWYLSEVPVDPQAFPRGLFAVVQAGLRTRRSLVGQTAVVVVFVGLDAADVELAGASVISELRRVKAPVRL